MGRYLGSVCKLCRRAGEKLFLKGDKCYTPKCPVSRRAYPPGQHGKDVSRKKKVSDYSVRLREKQKGRRIYGLSEHQFANYYEEAAQKRGVTGEQLLQFLERRLDNVVYRMGIASSRAAARQLVHHGHIRVGQNGEGRTVTIPSYRVSPGEVVRTDQTINLGDRLLPSWLEVNPEAKEGKVLALPAREEMELGVNEQAIVEFYSR